MECVCLEVKLDKIAINIILGLKIGKLNKFGIRVGNWTWIVVRISYKLNIVSQWSYSSARQLRNAKKSIRENEQGYSQVTKFWGIGQKSRHHPTTWLWSAV